MNYPFLSKNLVAGTKFCQHEFKLDKLKGQVLALGLHVLLPSNYACSLLCMCTVHLWPNNLKQVPSRSCWLMCMYKDTSPCNTSPRVNTTGDLLQGLDHSCAPTLSVTWCNMDWWWWRHVALDHWFTCNKIESEFYKLHTLLRNMLIQIGTSVGQRKNPESQLIGIKFMTFHMTQPAMSLPDVYSLMVRASDWCCGRSFLSPTLLTLTELTSFTFHFIYEA